MRFSTIAGDESPVQNVPDEEGGGTEQEHSIRMNLAGLEDKTSLSRMNMSGSGTCITLGTSMYRRRAHTRSSS